jgi:gas vesicle protein
MGKLNEQSKSFFEQTLKESKKQIALIDSEIEEKLARVKEEINDLQEQKKSARQIYDGAATVLGIKNEFEEDDSK